MKPENAIILSVGVLAAALIAYSFAKEKPYLAASIMGSFSALGLLYSLMKE